MARTSKTGFDRYFITRMKNPAFTAEYTTARSETDTVDALVRSLDAAREKAGLTKTALAKLADMKPELVRRLFTAKDSNPTLFTVVKLASALNCSVELSPRTGRRPRRRLLEARVRR
jgi:DNA-binding phage protein